MHGDITLSLHEAAQKFNHVISSPNPAANVQVGARQICASVEKTEYSAPPSVRMLQFAQTLKCQHRHQEHHYCHQVIETKLDG